jgi:predicted ATP-grasp superfamily ATP-dependent carboligase
VHNWRVSEDCTLSDYNLILFVLSIKQHKNNLSGNAGDYTRKYATQAENWKLFQTLVRKSSNQWRKWINSATQRKIWTPQSPTTGTIWKKLPS